MPDPDLAGFSREGLGLVDPSTGYLVSSNPALRDLLACPEPEGRDFASFLVQDWARARFLRLLENPQEAPAGPWNVEVRPLEGPPFPARIELLPFPWRDRPHLGLVVREERERFRFVQKAGRAACTRGILKAAPSLLHRFNNFLGPVLGYSEALMDLLAQEPQAREMAGKIREAAWDAAHLARQVASLLAAEGEGPRRLDLGPAAEHVAGLLSQTARKKRVKVESRIQEGLWVYARQSLLLDLLLDLSLGALESCREGDILEFRLRTETGPPLEGRETEMALLTWICRPWRAPGPSRPSRVPSEWPYLAASLMGGELRLPSGPGEPTMLSFPRVRAPS